MSDRAIVTPPPEPAEPPLAKRLLAEGIGTFFLVVAALLSPPALTFALVGAVLLIIVVAIGKVSGAHINPAVTVGLMTVRKIPIGTGLLYIVAQIVGAFLALGLGRLVDRGFPQTDPQANAMWFEMLGVALLVFVVTRVVLMDAPPAASALAIGVSLMTGIAIAGGSSGGILNPAVAAVFFTGDFVRGEGFAGGTYIIAPLVAAVVAALLARAVHED
ncbi:MAG: Aquaporin Z [uncultured Truepera sp.]|uniref:Aquaporin Z n=1 Tax=uncultured Truepera sp. TaxID=543023 RepID=A0A6J4VB82_9DEIN|nr:MAG: Aquaporin Z [uncultured Truepera sp.]